jgi:autoinducer 2-degrading protein
MIKVKEDHIDDFVLASTQNHQGSVREPGNLRFDVLQVKADPTRFILYEAYESEAAAQAHKETPHYLAWKETVADWMARPREGIACSVVCPVNRSKW